MSLAIELSRRIGTRVGRLSTGAAAMGALAVLLWPSDDFTFDAGAFVGFVAALCAWLWAEFSSLGDAHPNDVQLFRRLLETIKPEDRRRIRDQNMGDAFPVKAFDSFREVAETWQGASFEYQDKKIQEQWEILLSHLSDFNSKLALYTGVMPTNHAFGTVQTGRDLQTGQRSQTTLNNTKELNELAAKIYAKMNEFERLGRSRLRV